MLECVVNISEGRDLALLEHLRERCGSAVLDVHADRFHHRSVFTLAGPEVLEATQRLAFGAVDHIDLTKHDGVHPRIGAVDVVPFVPLGRSTIDEAIRARNAFASWASTELQVPCFLYGPKRTLPDIRRRAFTSTAPDCGPATAHPTAGAVAVGAREPLIAYNVWLEGASLAETKTIADQLRAPGLRTLGLQVGDRTQVSCNIIDLDQWLPSAVVDGVRKLATVAETELVGLLPEHVLEKIDSSRWEELDLSADRTIEARLLKAGLGES